MVAILEVAIYWLLWFLAYVVCYATGELILWAATLGRRRPRLIRRKDETASRASLLEELSFYVGAAFWIVSIGLPDCSVDTLSRPPV